MLDTGQDTKQSACKPLTLVRIPAEYLQTPDTGRGTCRVPAEYLKTPDTGRDTCTGPENP